MITGPGRAPPAAHGTLPAIGLAVWLAGVGAGLMALALGRSAAEPTGCGAPHPSDAAVEWTCRTIGRGESLESLFGDAWVDVARFNRIDRRHVRPGVRIRVPRDLRTIECYSPLPAYYEPADSDTRFVLVDLADQFLGAYEYGRCSFSAPITAGRADYPTPTGMFRITAFDRDHVSSLYRVEKTERPYPMHWGLRFHVDRSGASYWIHGRDLPGEPASHGCIGLFDESMQRECYGTPKSPTLADAKWLFEWVVGARVDSSGCGTLVGPRVQIRAGPDDVPPRQVAGDRGTPVR